MAKLFLKMGVTIKIDFLMRSADPLFQGLHLRFHRQEISQGRLNLNKEPLAMVLQTVLGEIAEARPFGDLEIAAIDRDDPGKDLQQGRLAGAVFAAEADPVIGADMPVDGIKDQPPGVILGHFS